MSVGVRVGSRYVATAVIGQGSFGTVFRADGPDGMVALKLLRPDIANSPEVVNRFLRERSVLLRMRHQNLVSVRDLVAEGDVLALVMDFVEGPDLRRYLTQMGPLPPAVAASLVAGIADGLAHTHAQGAVHRDLKPENVLLRLTSDGPVPLITDFGVARLAATGSTLTGPQMMFGTPAYLAPELVQGQHVSAPADVYACGVLLYELVSGRPPFSDDHPLALVHRHVTEVPQQPPGMPDELWPAVSACLAKDPAARPDALSLAAHLHELGARLGGRSSGQGYPAGPVSAPPGYLPASTPPGPPSGPPSSSGAPPAHRAPTSPGAGPASGAPNGGQPGMHGHAAVSHRTTMLPHVPPQEPDWPAGQVADGGWRTIALRVGALLAVALLGIAGGYAIGASTAKPAERSGASATPTKPAGSSKPTPAPTAITRAATELPFATVANGWGPIELNKSVGQQSVDDGVPITIAGQPHQTGLGVHAPSQARFYLGGKCSTFTATVGVDGEVAAAGGSVDFQVLVDGRIAYDSGVVRGADPAKPLSADITGGQVLDLVVTDAGDGNANDHADWADAQLVCAP